MCVDFVKDAENILTAKENKSFFITQHLHYKR